MNGLTHGLSRLFSRRSERSPQLASDIGFPTDVRQHVHVSKNHLTGDLEGLPAAWKRLVDTQISPAEQHDHPDAAYQAVKFYNYSIKKKETIEPFKQILTEEAFCEESRRIDQLLDDKHAREQRSSDASAGQSSGEETVVVVAPPPAPATIVRRSAPAIPYGAQSELDRPLNKVTAVVDLSVIEEDPNESPVLRKKERMYASLSDEEIYEELRKLCNSENAHSRFERLKDVGTGASGEYF